MDKYHEKELRRIIRQSKLGKEKHDIVRSACPTGRQVIRGGRGGNMLKEEHLGSLDLRRK
jgi:hypothetical protein